MLQARGGEMAGSKKKTTGMQGQLDMFVESLDHQLDTSTQPANVPGSPSRKGVLEPASGLPMDVSDGGGSLAQLVAVFAVLTVLMLVVIWYFWPDPLTLDDDASPVSGQVASSHTPAMAEVSSGAEKSRNELTSQVEIPASASLSVSSADKESIASRVSNPVVVSGSEETVMEASAGAVTQQQWPQLQAVSVDLALTRDAPNRHGKIVARLGRGTVVNVVGQQDDWLHIALPDGRQLWGYHELFKPAAGSVAAPVSATPKAAAEDVRMSVNVDIANIRSSAGRGGRIVIKLARGAVVTRIGKQADWFHVRLANGAMGWAHRSIF